MEGLSSQVCQTDNNKKLAIVTLPGTLNPTSLLPSAGGRGRKETGGMREWGRDEQTAVVYACV